MVRYLAAIVAILLLTAEAVSAQKMAAASAPQRHVVEIRDFGFHPARIRVSPGDTIVWVNMDIVPHTATAEDRMWGSPALEEGASWEMVVENGKTQSYFCEFHPHMQGVLEISEKLRENASRNHID